MKILITNFYFDNFAGSEKYTASLAHALSECGHDVTIFSPICGKIAQKSKIEGLKVYDDISELKDVSYDVIHAHHNVTAILARSVFPKTPMIFVSHGPTSELEQPPSLDIGISHFVAISEEVKLNMVKCHNLAQENISIFRNFVDLLRIPENKVSNEKPKNVLVLSNHYIPSVRRVVEDATNQMGLDLVHIGRPDNEVEDVNGHIQAADIVITLGKGILESSVHGRASIIYDMHGSDGLLTMESYDELKKVNFSGRRYAKKINSDDLVEIFSQYNRDKINQLALFIREEHSLKNIVKKYEELYSKVAKTNVDAQIPRKYLYNEITFLINKYKSEFVKLKENKDVQDQILLKQKLNKEKILERDDLISRLKRDNKHKSSQLAEYQASIRKNHSSFIFYLKTRIKKIFKCKKS